MSGSPKTEEKVCHQHCWNTHIRTKHGPDLVVIRNTSHDGVCQLQWEVSGEAKFRDCSVVITEKYFSGLSCKSVESKWPGCLNFRQRSPIISKLLTLSSSFVLIKVSLVGLPATMLLTMCGAHSELECNVQSETWRQSDHRTLGHLLKMPKEVSKYELDFFSS